MPKQKVVVLLGSKSDLKFATAIGRVLKDCQVDHEFRVTSAHRTPERLLKILVEYEKSEGTLVYVTVAGLSDALSGVVAGFTKYPVIACPPDFEGHGWPKVFSSAMTPKGVSVSFVPQPENAALAAVKILALSNPSLYDRIQRRKEKGERRVVEADEELGERSSA